MQYSKWLKIIGSAAAICITVCTGLFTATAKGAVSAAAPPETVVYPFTNFQLAMPGVWISRPGVDGSVERQTGQTHDGKRIIRLNWDFTGAKNPANNFVNFTWHRRLLGRPLAVQAWICTPSSDVGAKMALELTDATGQYFLSRLTMNHAGWHDYRFPIAGVPAAWKSGAGDEKQHFPLELFGFVVEWPGHAGYLLLSDITVISRGPPRAFIMCTPVKRQSGELEVPHFTGWGQAPSCRLHIVNYAHTPESNLTVMLRAKDAITGQVAWEGRILVPVLQGEHGHDVDFTPRLGNGVFNLKYSLSAEGRSLPYACGQIVIARMMAHVAQAPYGKAERLYVRHWGLSGGVFWQCPPARAAATGAAWQRCWANWAPMEPKPGRFDFANALHNVEAARRAGLGVVYLTTLYTQPSFYHEDRASFAPAYGRLLKGAATALGSLVRWYELGNEDNGRTKFLYTEVGRNGAAAVRLVDPMAMLGNSATAGVDIGWLRMQARRELFDDLDAVITHPYPWGKSPEAAGVLKQFARVNRFIDTLGGMKFQFTTEFGYSQDASNTEFFAGQLGRAQWIPRHFAIASAAGVMRDGLYSWDGDFGIYNNGAPYPAAASVNAFCHFTYASHFAGWWQRDPVAWAIMFARAGIPLLMAWSPANRGTLTLHNVTTGTHEYDMYGNSLVNTPTRGQLVLHLTGSPTYVTGLPTSMLRRALTNAAHRARLRYARNLATSSLHNLKPWRRLAAVDAPPLPELATVLEGFSPAAPTISHATQATIAQSIRRMILAAHIAALTSNSEPAKWTGIHRAAWNAWANRLEYSVKHEDIDLPAVRWVLEKWRQVHDEAAMCHELGDDHLAGLLSDLDPVFDHLCAVLTVHGPKIFFAAWPYLYQGGRKTPLVENLQLVTGKPVPVKVRLDSYASRPCHATVTFKAPPHWRITPNSWVGTIMPDKSRVLHIMITAGASVPKAIVAMLSVPGKPLVRLAYDNFTVLPPLQATSQVAPGFLPRVSLPLKITNNSALERSTTVHILQEPSDRPLVTVRINNLQPGEQRTLQVKLPRNLPVPAYNQWHLQAELSTSGDKHYQFPLTVDFSGAPYAVHAPTIGDDWSHWKEAAPLHLNKAVYTHGSVGNWKKSDLAGVVYTMWDKRCLYLAVRVHSNQPFHQDLDGSVVWQQDSVQFAIAPRHDRQGYVEFSLAQTSRGPQVWCYKTNQLVSGARLNVKIKPHLTIYQAAIPWSAIPAIHPAAGSRWRFDILLNKYYGGTRAYMERYGTTIVNGPWNPETMGWLHLLPPSPF